MRRMRMGAAGLATVLAACASSGITPGEALFSNTVAACRTLAYEEGLEVVEMGEAESVSGGAQVAMQVRGDGDVETRSCMFREGYDSARFVNP
jgi:hypothetical protein